MNILLTGANGFLGKIIYRHLFESNKIWGLSRSGSVLKKVGFFDENIFMYLEDADITRRFLEYSNTCYFPKAIVYHYYSGLTHKEWKFKLITIQSAIYYFNKWGWLKSIF
jgi:GT2 family glycosyltransferase